MNDNQTREVQTAPIQKIECALLDEQIGQDVDLVRCAIGDVNETGDKATQIQQKVQLDSCLDSTKRCPREHRQAHVDGDGIERVDLGIQIDAWRFLGLRGTGCGDEVLRQVCVDLPRSGGVRVGQCVARCRLAAKAHLVQPSGLGLQIDLDVAQRFASAQLSKRHDQKLIQAGEIIDLALAAMRGKCIQRQECHALRKHELALVHTGLQRPDAKAPKSDALCSSRRKTKCQTLQVNH